MRKSRGQPVGMETIAEIEGADDEENGKHTAREHIKDSRRRRKSRAEKNSQANNFEIDPADENDSDEFDNLGRSGRAASKKMSGASTKEAF